MSDVRGPHAAEHCFHLFGERARGRAAVTADGSFDGARWRPHPYKIGVAKRLDGRVKVDRPYYSGLSPAYCACAFSIMAGARVNSPEKEKRRKGEKGKKGEG